MLHPSLVAKPTTATRPITLLTAGTHEAQIATFGDLAQRFLHAIGFTPKAGKIALLPGADGGIERVVMVIDPARRDPFFAARLPAALPEGIFAFETPPAEAELATLAFAMAGYKFTRYKKLSQPKAQLVVPKGVNGARVSRMADAIAFGRDLINTPPSELGPEALARAATDLAEANKAEVSEIIGRKLLKKNFPLIHAVGRAAAQEPRLVDFTWGNPKHPKVTLVGKGVCFDTGGLNIKPDSAMLLMKKDMGGAATALTAARMIMEAGLKVRLRVLVPIVENAISADAFRPGDVLTSRKGLTVEIGNTDAEGRLVLADALALADEEAPELLIDFATLTGAARVALGPELPPFYVEDDKLADEIMDAGTAQHDPVWRLPLWTPYNAIFASKIADLNNAGTGGMAGSITAALFLRRFVEKARHHIHFDMYGWAPATSSGLPEGGHPQVARLVLGLLEKRYGA